MEKRRIKTIAECEVLNQRTDGNWFDGEKWRSTWLHHGDDAARKCDEGTDDRDEDGWHVAWRRCH